jgi:uncharacterized cupredoxin-like copper-binding protein
MMWSSGIGGVAVLLAATLPAPAQHSHQSGGYASRAGAPGDPRKAARAIEVVMREADGKMLFAPDRIEVKHGEQVRFVLKNAGELDHEFFLGTAAEIAAHLREMQQSPDMRHEDANARTLAPKAEGALAWRFTTRGQFDFVCLIPGHLEAGMKGSIVVK